MFITVHVSYRNYMHFLIAIAPIIVGWAKKLFLL